MAYNELAQIYEMRNPATGMLYQPEELNIYDWNELGVAMLEDNVFVRSDWLDLPENQDITRRFVKATAKGWIYCRDNEEACKDMLHEHGPHQQWMMREVNRLIWPSPLGIGKMDPDALSRTLTVLSDAGELGSTPSTHPLSDSSYMEWALQSLTEEGYDTIGQDWDEPELHFCMNAGQTTFTICDALEATVCPAGSYATAVGVCSLCPPGSEAPNTGTGNKCQACPEGTFSSKTQSRTAQNTMDEAGGVTCLGCPTGTRTGDDGRIICGRAGFEESFMKVIENQKALVGAWLSCFVLAAGGFFWVRRKYPTADASIVLEAVASLLELILDANFLHLLTSEGRQTYFAIALTGFCSHLVLNIAIIAVFMHHEVQRDDIRQWAFKNVNALAVTMMISVPNPRLLEILSSRIGSSTTWTRAPFSHQAEIALSIVGKVPQVGVDILILQKDGWHLNPLLASITNSAMLLRGIIYYLILNILYLYTKRLGGAETGKDGKDGKEGTGSNPYPAETSQREVDLERVKRELAMARRKVKELEAKFGPLDSEEGYPNALSSYKFAESLSRRTSGAHVNGDGLP
ncbi:hypothetical protein HDU85_000809 [Gaertneriomyces sp. JEL0708]|nr:hypothetical protein HDU85_000809 [Gaertneriomyces sp. JEL0708]